MPWLLHGQSIPAHATFPLSPALGQTEHWLLITVPFSIIPSLEKKGFIHSRSFYLVLVFELHNQTMRSTFIGPGNMQLQHGAGETPVRAKEITFSVLFSPPLLLMEHSCNFVKLCIRISLDAAIACSQPHYGCSPSNSKERKWPTLGHPRRIFHASCRQPSTSYLLAVPVSKTDTSKEDKSFVYKMTLFLNYLHSEITLKMKTKALFIFKENLFSL